MSKEQVYAAIEAHYREKQATTVSRIAYYLQNKAMAEDVVQEAYLRCCQYWKSYDPGETIAAWFNTILNNSIKDAFKKMMTQGMAHDLPPADAPRSTILDTIELKELLVEIESQPQRVARILHLFLIEGYYSHEIAEIVPENSSTIRKTVQRFRDGLKDRNV
jgi:RNA polymerase sigma factor (sigma-70 family)